MLALGAKMGPRRPNKPPEAPKIASKTDLGAILVHFWLIFYGFLVGLGVHFGSCCLLWFWFVALLVCWFVGLLVCWLVALLVFLVCWLSVCRLSGPESKARGRIALALLVRKSK